MKKIFALVLAMMLVLGMTAALADTPHTITIGHAVLGETYTAYKLMDATFQGDTVSSTTPISYYYQGASTDALYGILDNYFQFEAFQDGKAQLKVVNENGEAISYDTVDVTALAAEINAAMEAGTLSLTEAGQATAEDVNGVPTATISVDSRGYYFVNTTLGAVCSIDTAANVTIEEKNTTTTTDKKVQEDSTNNYGDKNDADVGQTVTFQSTVTIGRHQKNVVFHDIMQTEKLAFNYDVAVTGATVGGTNKYTICYPAHGDSESTMPTGEAYAGDTFAVQFDNAWTESLDTDTTVTITYSAVVTENAIIGLQSGLAMDAGNDNKSRVDYGNDQHTSWDWTRTYVWSFDIYKYAAGENNTTIPLADAEFQLKKGTAVLHFDLVQTGAAAVEADPENNIEAQAATPTIYRYNASGSVTTLVTPASGLIKIVGLDADTYSLVETAAPRGYNKLANPIAVVIDSDTDTDQGDNNASQGATMTLTQDGETATQIGVLNQTGTELPSTGGIGTTIFYVGGGILVLAAVILLVTKRRMSNND